jgi:hypothetical protein
VTGPATRRSRRSSLPDLARAARSVVVLALFTAVSTVLFGWQLWPHPGRGVVGLHLIQDPEAFVWEFGWWAHALASLTNPFVTDVIYHPVGANVTWTATAPGLAFAFVPLTMLVGPVAAYNAAVLLEPALAAWTAFHLCRYLTRSTWASVVAGYLFGFSSFTISHVYSGDANVAGFLMPVVALVILRYLRGELSSRGLACRLGPILALQLVVSTELALTLTFAIIVGLVLGYAVAPAYRKRVASAPAPIGAAYLIAALLTAPFLYYLFSDVDLSDITGGGDDDLLNLVLPTRLVAAGGQFFSHVTSHFRSGLIDSDLYVGIPALLILGLYLWRRRRDPGGRFLALALLVSWILSLGTALRVEGHRVFPLPWTLALHVSLLDHVLETRLAVYATLAVSVAVALWTASTRGRWTARPIVLPVLAVAALLPATWRNPLVATPVRPEFFTQKLYKLCIPRGETLLIFPFGRFGDSNVYQAESGFWFQMAEGNLGRDQYPSRFVLAGPTVEQLQFSFYSGGPRPTMSQLKALAKRLHVDRVLLVVGSEYPSLTQMHAFGPLQVLGGVGVAPACGHDSLAGDTRRIPGQ